VTASLHHVEDDLGAAVTVGPRATNDLAGDPLLLGLGGAAVAPGPAGEGAVDGRERDVVDPVLLIAGGGGRRIQGLDDRKPRMAAPRPPSYGRTLSAVP